MAGSSSHVGWKAHSVWRRRLYLVNGYVLHAKPSSPRSNCLSPTSDLPKPVRLVVLRRDEEAVEGGGEEELPPRGDNQRNDQQLPTGRDLPPLSARAAYIHVQVGAIASIP